MTATCSGRTIASCELSANNSVNKDHDFNSAVQSEIATLLNTCLAQNMMSGLSQSMREQLLYDEARKMYDSIDATIMSNQFAQRHNKRMRRRENLFCALGVLCLVYPMLITFDRVMSLFPEDSIEVLQYAAQNKNPHGLAAEFSLNVVLLALQISNIDTKRGRIYMAICFGTLAFLLLLVRHTTRRQQVLTTEQLNQVKGIKRLIQEELEKKKSQLRYEHLRA